jgi:hypothetical protein
MGKVYDGIDAKLADWIAAQRLFFVATAPSGSGGHVNCSPKGGDTLRVLGPHALAFVDGGGSGIETISHLRDNGRICVMLCAFDGPARILRLHGRGEIVDPLHADFDALLSRFPRWPLVRAIVRVTVTRIADSCGYGVPLYDYRAERVESAQYVAKASDATLRHYLLDHNQRGLDGLPALTPEQIEAAVVHRPHPAPEEPAT